jgi:hypothetical protein
MARSIRNNSSVVKVTFSLEERPLTFAQKEAGKRLFSSLIARAQAETQSSTKDTAIEEKAGRKTAAQADWREPPSVSDEENESPLTN